jgi:site-specific DNA-methyltransferase (adenine-specific)
MNSRPKSCQPYYDAGGITIYNCDVRDLWPIEADVIVTDPPYGMDYRSKRGESVAGDQDTELRDWMLEQWGDRPSLVFGTWRCGRPLCRALLVWDKGRSPGMGDLRLPWGPSHEEIYVRGAGWRTQRRQGSVLSYDMQSAASQDRPDHPTPKPVALMRHLLERCPEGVVLDPFMGSGSTLVAAKDLGRRAIGVEREERYCAMAVERLSQEVLDLGLKVE